MSEIVLSSAFRKAVATAAMTAGLTVALAGVPAGAGEPAFTRTADSPGLQWGACPDFMPDGCAISVLHGDPAKPGADVFFKLPAGLAVPSHRHTSAERMVLVAGRMEVVYEGQEPVLVEAGTYAYGPPQLAHHATCVSDEDCVLFIAFDAPVDAIPTEQ